MKTQNTIPAQPNDPNDPVYNLIKTYLTSGDRKVIAQEVEVSYGLVSRVINGKSKSPRVWSKVVSVAMTRKQQKESFVKYMTA